MRHSTAVAFLTATLPACSLDDNTPGDPAKGGSAATAGAAAGSSGGQNPGGGGHPSSGGATAGSTSVEGGGSGTAGSVGTGGTAASAGGTGGGGTTGAGGMSFWGPGGPKKQRSCPAGPFPAQQQGASTNTRVGGVNAKTIAMRVPGLP